MRMTFRDYILRRELGETDGGGERRHPIRHGVGEDQEDWKGGRSFRQVSIVFARLTIVQVTGSKVVVP